MSDTAVPHSSEHIELVNIKVFVDGDPLDGTYQITELNVHKQLNKINKADVYFLDGEVAEGTFPIMESGEFTLGTSIKIEIGYGTGEENEVAFRGVIAQVDVQTHSNRRPMLIVRCVDEAFKMTINPQYYLYEDLSDAELFRDLVDRHDLSTGEVEATSFTYPSIMQFSKTDWDLLLSRANRIGCMVYTHEGKVFVKKPDTSNKTIKVNFGRDIIRQQLSFTAKSLLSNVTAQSWDATNQELRSEDASTIEVPKQGDESTDTSKVASAFSDLPQKLLSHADLDTSVIKDRASGKLLEHELSKINGYIVVPGTNAPQLNSIIEILKMGNYFTGNGYITGIEHRVKAGKWTTKITIGIKKETWYKNVQEDFAENSIAGLQVGIVKQMHDDPAGNARILVEIPGLEGEGKGVWARVLQRYATNGAGAMVFPEIDDEVVIGFISQDTHSPVVLGCLYSQTNAPPLELEEGNPIKAFVSNEQLKCLFDEEKKEIYISTPGGNKVTLSDDQKGILLEDQNGNSLRLDDKGIAIESQSDCKIKVQGDLTLESMGKTAIKSTSSDISLECMNLKSKANMKIENKANIIDTKATAQAILKGGIVQIN